MTPAPAIDPPEVLGAFLRGDPVARLTGHEFEGLASVKELVRAIHASFERALWRAENPSIGVVALTRSGVNDSLRHGYGRAKLAAFAALPELISRGKVARSDLDWKSRGYGSCVLAAPVEISGRAYCAFVVVHKVQNGDVNYYLHEVAELCALEKAAGGGKSASERTGGLRSGLAPCGGEVDPPAGDIRSIALSIFAVNGGRA